MLVFAVMLVAAKGLVIKKYDYMKTINFITHPYPVLISFLFLLISGEHLGGFYIMYLLIGLPHAAIHSILGIFGVIILLLNKAWANSEWNDLIKPIINIGGALLMIGSLFTFFYNDSVQYNVATFYQLVPQLCLSVFILLFFFLFNKEHLYIIKSCQK